MTSPAQQELDTRRLRGGLLLAVGIGAAASVVLVLVAGGRSVLAAMGQLPLPWLAAALALAVVSWFGQGVSWGSLTRLGAFRHLHRMTTAFLAGDFPALVTPFGSGGLPGGVFALTREGLSAGEASAVVAMHLLLTAVFFVVAGAIAAAVLPAYSAGSSAAVWSGFVAIVAVLALITWIALRPRDAISLLERALRSRLSLAVLGPKRVQATLAAAEREEDLFAHGVRRLARERPGALALSLAGLFFSRLCMASALPVIVYGLGWRGDALPLLAIAVGGMVLSIASPTPGGSGTVEAGTTALLATLTTAPIAGAAAILWRVTTYYSEVLVGGVFFLRYLAMTPRSAPKE